MRLLVVHYNFHTRRTKEIDIEKEEEQEENTKGINQRSFMHRRRVPTKNKILCQSRVYSFRNVKIMHIVFASFFSPWLWWRNQNSWKYLAIYSVFFTSFHHIPITQFIVNLFNRVKVMGHTDGRYLLFSDLPEVKHRG